MLAALVVTLRSLALICGGQRAVALENLALRQIGSLHAHCHASPTPPPRSDSCGCCSPTRGGIGAQPLIVVHPDTGRLSFGTHNRWQG